MFISSGFPFHLIIDELMTDVVLCNFNWVCVVFQVMRVGLGAENEVDSWPLFLRTEVFSDFCTVLWHCFLPRKLCSYFYLFNFIFQSLLHRIARIRAFAAVIL